ncbi:hypothetical protein [Streptomyces hesseae]|uniref:Uncharacterized protein n=1 Tax=Streptomyces hesseae TaxID=3075519 RepID=A0ABU2SLU9_9ACTN|nr:hypothetical protein [Streptomyces sp. DSM 40473]MDT0449963.1 hypothetical protein [Streptomyces sp. DSM 40473]
MTGTYEWAGESLIFAAPPTRPAETAKRWFTLDVSRDELPTALLRTQTGRQQQTRILLRQAAQQLEGGRQDSTLETLRRAWDVAPGAWGFSLTPDSAIACGQYGHIDRGDGTGYRAEADAKAWFEQHVETCVPIRLPNCHPCICGGCRAPSSPTESCPACLCFGEDE